MEDIYIRCLIILIKYTDISKKWLPSYRGLIISKYIEVKTAQILQKGQINIANHIDIEKYKTKMFSTQNWQIVVSI